MANPGGSDEAEGWRADPPPFGRGDLVAILIWTAAIVVFFWDVVALRKALFYFDITEINFPYRDFFARELRAGRFSRWCPGLYCGLPLYSESQAGYLHPLKYLLYPWLETWQAFNLDTVLSIWLCGLGSYGWLRRHVRPAGALTGAAVLGLSGFMWGHFIHTSMVNALASVPLIFWATEWAWDRGKKLGVVLAALALAAQVFAGHLQDTIITLGALGVYTLFRAVTEPDWKARWTTLGTAAAVVALGVALSAVQWIPSKELLDRSPRAGGLSHGDLVYGSWHPELLPTLVVREAYGTRARDTDWMDGFYPYHEMDTYFGMTALSLALLGAAARRDRWVAFWVLLAAAAMVLMLGKFTILFDHAQRIPIVGSSREPVRAHLWLFLALSALAAVGVDRLERGFPVRLRTAAAVAGVLVLLSIPIALYVYAPIVTEPTRWSGPNHIARYRWLGRELTVAVTRTLLMGLAGGIAIRLAARSRSASVRLVACWLLPVVVIADLMEAHWYDVATISPAYWTTPPATARKLAADPSFVRVFGIADKHSGEPGYASEPLDFFPVRDNLGWSLPPVWGLRSSGGNTPIIARRMLDFTDHVVIGRGRWDVEAVTHIVTGRHSGLNLGETERVGAAVIHRNPQPLPRARIMGRPVYVENRIKAINAIDRLREAIRDRVVVEDPDRPLPPDASPTGSARVVRDDPEWVTVEAETSGPAYLTLADTFDPGWRATIDGKTAPIRPAWLTFRAVYLPAGKHLVEFRYTPAGFPLGLTISLAGLVAAAVALAWPKPLPATGDSHATLPWPDWWPRTMMAGAVVLVVLSTFAIGPQGQFHISDRWTESLHQFTWGSGLEAMRQQRK